MTSGALKDLLRSTLSATARRIPGLRTDKPKADDPNRLFDGDDADFKRIAGSARRYFEYGCGASTFWVARNTSAEIYSTDTSGDWIRKVGEGLAGREGTFLHHTDLGPVGNWGVPQSFSKRANIRDYTDWFWDLGLKPDVVLIDGRFRVCCFLTCLMRAPEGCTLIFDDYRDREHFHVVEDFLKPARLCGRQAIFPVGTKAGLDLEVIAQEIECFRYVMA